MLAVSAVDSPQTKAPAPWLMRMSKSEAGAQDVVAQQAALARLRERVAQALDGQRVLVAHVHVALVGADRERGDEHALDDRVRVVFEHGAVHERAGVALVAVADEVVLVARVGAAEAPLLAGREAGAAAAAQAAGLDLVDDAVGVVLGEHACASAR